MKINELKEEIEKQKEINIKLYKSIPMASHEDPLNEKAEPILKQWREGSAKLKKMIAELQELESKEKKSLLDKPNNTNKTFVNGFGEATTREITNTSYRRIENRTKKQMLSFVGGTV